MHDVRHIAGTGFIALFGALLAMLAMSQDMVGERVGIWLVTTSLGVYGVALGVGRLLEHDAEEQRRGSRK